MDSCSLYPERWSSTIYSFVLKVSTHQLDPSVLLDVCRFWGRSHAVGCSHLLWEKWWEFMISSFGRFFRPPLSFDKALFLKMTKKSLKKSIVSNFAAAYTACQVASDSKFNVEYGSHIYFPSNYGKGLNVDVFSPWSLYSLRSILDRADMPELTKWDISRYFYYGFSTSYFTPAHEIPAKCYSPECF